MNDYVKIGATKKTFGVNGGLKAHIEDRYLGVLDHLEVLFLMINQRPTPFFVAKVEETNGLILYFEDVVSKELAQPYCATDILVSQKDLEQLDIEPASASDDYDQILGFELEVKGKVNLGVIEEIAELPEQIMAILNYQETEVLIPLNEAFIIEIDPQNKKIVMDLPEGLLELFGIS